MYQSVCQLVSALWWTNTVVVTSYNAYTISIDCHTGNAMQYLTNVATDSSISNLIVRPDVSKYK